MYRRAYCNGKFVNIYLKIKKILIDDTLPEWFQWPLIYAKFFFRSLLYPGLEENFRNTLYFMEEFPYI